GNHFPAARLAEPIAQFLGKNKVAVVNARAFERRRHRRGYHSRKVEHQRVDHDEQANNREKPLCPAKEPPTDDWPTKLRWRKVTWIVLGFGLHDIGRLQLLVGAAPI